MMEQFQLFGNPQTAGSWIPAKPGSHSTGLVAATLYLVALLGAAPYDFQGADFPFQFHCFGVG